jgi:hypothetical protein
VIHYDYDLIMTPNLWNTPDAELISQMADKNRLAQNLWRVPVGIGIGDGRLFYPTEAFTTPLVPQGVSPSFKMVKPGDPRLLLDFIQLAEAEDTRILEYAERWGVLGICTHQWPTSSCPHGKFIEEHNSFFCAPDGYRSHYSEKLSTWRGFAGWAGLIITCASVLHADVSADERDTVFARFVGRERLTYREQWWFVGLQLNRWLELAPLKPKCRFLKIPKGGVRPEFALGPTSVYDFSQLIAVLGLELLYQVTRARRILTCSSCGRPYQPKHLPKRGEHTYCRRVGCGTRAAWRDAQQRRREAQRNKSDDEKKGRST